MFINHNRFRTEELDLAEGLEMSRSVKLKTFQSFLESLHVGLLPQIKKDLRRVYTDEFDSDVVEL